MPRSNWRQFIPAGIVALLSVFATVLVYAWTLPEDFFAYGREEYDASSRYHYQADPDCYPSSLMRLAPEGVRKSKQAECENIATDYKREVDDLTQQTRAAEAVEKANWLAQQNVDIARVQAVLSVIAAIATAWAAWAASRAAVVAERVLEVENRGYLGIKRMEFNKGTVSDEGVKVSAFIITPVIQNFGSAPVLMTSFKVKWRFVTGGLDGIDWSDTLQERQVKVLAVPGEPLFTNRIPISIEASEAVFRNERRLLYMLCIKYSPVNRPDIIYITEQCAEFLIDHDPLTLWSGETPLTSHLRMTARGEYGNAT